MRTLLIKRLGVAVAALSCLADPLRAAQNKAPVANNDSYSANVNTTLTVAAPGVLANDTDQNADSLTAVLGGNVSHGSLQLFSNGSFSYTPASNFAGTDTFAYKANDGAADSGVASVTISVVVPGNHPPVANNDTFTINENVPLEVGAPGVLTNDTDADGDPLTAVLVSNVSHGSLSLGIFGGLIYSPGVNFSGTDTFTYKANDGKSDSGIATVTINVIVPPPQPPVAFDSNLPIRANSSVPLSVYFAASDANEDPLTFRVIQFPSHGTLTGTAPDMTYTPNLNFIGDDSLAFVANDGQSDSNIGTIHLRVLPVLSINNVSALEGGLGSRTVTFTVTLDPPSLDIVTVNWKTADGTALAPGDYVAGSGTLTFSPGAQHLTLSVSIVSDLRLEPDETFSVRLLTPVNALLSGSAAIGTCTILNDDSIVGVIEGIPAEALVAVGERFIYGIKWTHPQRWRLLDTVDIRITDDDGDVLYVRFDEPSNTYSLLEPANQRFMRPALPGSRTLFETPAVTMDVKEISVVGTGPQGPSVTLNLALRFKPKAAGRVLRVEAFATDDFGNQQGFDQAGTIGVLGK